MKYSTCRPLKGKYLCTLLQPYRKTPLFCAILSGDIKFEQKKEIVKMWFDTYSIDLSLRKKTGEDLLELAKKNNLYDYIVEFCMRED
jgi:hypothetical protein